MPQESFPNQKLHGKNRSSRHEFNPEFLKLQVQIGELVVVKLKQGITKGGVLKIILAEHPELKKFRKASTAGLSHMMRN